MGLKNKIMEQIKAPFTPEQVKNLNVYQQLGHMHPFTGTGMADTEGHKSRSNCPDQECLLKATTDGWVCPCGQYKQNWAHAFMAEPVKCAHCEKPVDFENGYYELPFHGDKFKPIFCSTACLDAAGIKKYPTQTFIV
jgi:hypothetical protein